MTDFSVNEMLAMQEQLQEKYRERWEEMSVENIPHKLLWMVGEIGEVIDIVKKNGSRRAVSDPALRAALVEEMADVMMYYHDVMLCCGITAEELKRAYTQKFERNMSRW